MRIRGPLRGPDLVDCCTGCGSPDLPVPAGTIAQPGEPPEPASGDNSAPGSACNILNSCNNSNLRGPEAGPPRAGPPIVAPAPAPTTPRSRRGPNAGADGEQPLPVRAALRAEG